MRRLRVNDRILLHIADHEGEEGEKARSLTPLGIARAIDGSCSYTYERLQLLEAEGLILRESGHSKGLARNICCYTLSEIGRAQVRVLRYKRSRT